MVFRRVLGGLVGERYRKAVWQRDQDFGVAFCFL